MNTYLVSFRMKRLLLFSVLLLTGMLLLPAVSHAQKPTQRELRSYIPPDQLVSFSASTPFDTFIEFVNPIFERVAGKRVVDPEGRAEAIGVNIAQMHFFDALELVLEANGLTYRETSNAFIVQQAPEPGAAGGSPALAGAGTGAAAAQELPATAASQEVEINAIFFEVNRTRSREMGLDWSTFLGGGQVGSGGGGGTGGGRTGQGGQESARIVIRTEEFFDRFDDVLIGPDEIEVATLAEFIRFMETEGLGETIANPSISVQSGEQGRIQIGSDIPVQTRDFAGNTVTQFFSTGVIVEVTPTVLTEPVADTLGAPMLDFVHMNVQVENSSSRPSGAGAPVIDRSVANTQVLMLDGEQTMIGGLYSTDKTVNRKGIPLLKDLPAWFFGLRYIFGFDQVSKVQKELMIVLQADVVAPISARVGEPLEEDLLENRREEIRRVLQQFSEKKAQETETPPESYR